MWKAEEPWPAGCTLFIPFQDPENVGAGSRSAAAFGVGRAVLFEGGSAPVSPKERLRGWAGGLST